MSAILETRGVVKRFHHGFWPARRTVTVLDGADLTVDQGELVGLVGENGSGKSTTGRLGYCPQQPLLWEKLTVGEHFALFGRAYDMGGEAAQGAGTRLMSELAFERYAGYRVEALSGGTRQKLNLALALMHDPQLLLLDEPYAGFDWETYLRFWEIAEQRRAQGMGILVVSHLLTERGRLTRVLTLKDGRKSSEEVRRGAGGAPLHA